MKELLAGGFLFVGGAVIMTISNSGAFVPNLGAACAVLGAILLVGSLFKKGGGGQ